MSKFNVGDRVRLTVSRGLAAQVGAEAVVVIPEKKSEYSNTVYVHVNWDRTSGLAAHQSNGGYAPSHFELVKAAKVKKAPKPSQAYKGNGKHEWETVTGPTQRLRVPGGYLYASLSSYGRQHMTFVPMPEVVKHKV